MSNIWPAGLVASVTPSVNRANTSPRATGTVTASYANPGAMPSGTPLRASLMTASTSPVAGRYRSGLMCPALTTTTVLAAGSRTMTARVTNRSPIPPRMSRSFSRVTALAGHASVSSENRASALSLAIRRDAGTPFPATSPRTTATRPSGNAT